MNRLKAHIWISILVLTTLALTSCSGPFKGGTGGGGMGTLSFTLVADTPPANPSIFSFKVSIASITLTPTTGTAITFTPSSPIVVDLMRLQSDTAFLGTLANVPAGAYTVQVSLSTPASGATIAFLNDTGASLKAGSTTCAAAAVCTAMLTVNGTPTIASFTLTMGSTNQGVGLDFNLANAISISNGTLSVTFNPSAPSPGVLSAVTLPRANANLGSNQIDLIEDFTGVVSVSNNNVTVTSPIHGTITAVNSSSSFYDASPDNNACVPPATFSCVKTGQVASVDVFLNSDGTLALKEFESLAATQQDLVEGIVYTVSGTSPQFGIVVTNKIQAATGSLIANLSTGDLLTVNIPAPQPFFVDQKGLPVSSQSGVFGLFQAQTSVSAIHPGQSVAVHVTTFTAASGSTPASVVADTVMLRWSRFTANVVNASTITLINVSAVPSYFGLSSTSVFPTQIFTGTAQADGVTNFEGEANGGIPSPSPPPIGLRVLYFQNSTNTSSLPFLAAKIRVP